MQCHWWPSCHVPSTFPTEPYVSCASLYHICCLVHCNISYMLSLSIFSRYLFAKNDSSLWAPCEIEKIFFRPRVSSHFSPRRTSERHNTIATLTWKHWFSINTNGRITKSTISSWRLFEKRKKKQKINFRSNRVISLRMRCAMCVRVGWTDSRDGVNTYFVTFNWSK